MKKAIIIIIVLVVVIFVVFHINSSKKSVVKMNIHKIDEFNIKDRVCIKNEDVLFVGENIKEIDNGFYDLKIKNKDNGIDIYLNKLWYKDCNSDYIQDDYLANICRKIVEKININNNKDELEYMLYKYIKENYVSVRENKKISDILLENLNISLILEDNIPKLEIKGV